MSFPPAPGPERFLPFHLRDLEAACLEDATPELRAELERDFADLRDRIHAEFQGRRERLKRLYVPLDPGSDLRQLRPPGADELRDVTARFEAELEHLFEAANFEEVTRADLEDALGRASLFHVRLEVDFDDFEVLKIYRRGSSSRSESVPRGPFKLFPRQVDFVNYDRVAFYARFKGPEYFAAKGTKPPPFEPGSTLLKLFKNIPRGDLEMLFPNSEVRMRTTDKLLIGVPAIVGGVTVFTSKLISALGASLLLIGFWIGVRKERVELDEAATLALFGGLMALGMHSFRQWDKFKNRRIRFMKALTENLYYKTIDSDAGVFLHLLDAAEESEAKEAVVACHALAKADGALAADELDRRIETWFRERFSEEVDFDVADALGKLERFGHARREDEAWIRSRPGDAR